MSDYLQQYGIVKKPDKSSEIFETLFPDIFAIRYESPSEYVNYCWKKYNGHKGKNDSFDNLIIKYILATLLIREGLLPFYLQAEVVFVPNVRYDILIYTKRFGPVMISAKDSLREHYKQADLEAIALKYVHGRARNYLISFNEQEGKSIQQKMMGWDVVGFDKVILATTEEINSLVDLLKENSFFETQKNDFVKSALFVNKDAVLQ